MITLPKSSRPVRTSIKVLLMFCLLYSSLSLKGQNVGIGTLTPEDKLHLLGNMRISGGKIYFVNTGGSIFIGEEAGLNDNLSDNVNVFIGHHAGRNNTTGSYNIGIGAYTMQFSTATIGNVGVGNEVLASPTLTGNNNSALGLYALHGNTSGTANVAVGNESLKLNTSGNSNTAVGNGALLYSSTGNNNVGVGALAGLNSLGQSNTYLGAATGLNNISGSSNVFIGSFSGYNETGSNKLYISNSATSTPLLYGDFLLKKLTVNDTLQVKGFYMTGGATDGYILKSNGSGKASWVDPSTVVSNLWSFAGPDIYSSNPGNVGIGTTSPTDKLEVAGNIKLNSGRILFANPSNGIFIGNSAGASTTGPDNLFMGNSSGAANTSGQLNTAVGNSSFSANTTGHSNTVVGFAALSNSSTGIANTAIGGYSLFNNNNVLNVGVGFNAGGGATGSHNTFIGARAGYYTLGNKSVFIGYEAGMDEVSGEKLYIDNSSTSSPLIYGDFANNRLTVNDTLTTKAFGVGTTAPGEKIEVVGNLRVTNGRINFSNSASGIYIGANAGLNTAGPNNIFIGDNTGLINTTGQLNTVTGAFAFQSNTTGHSNTAYGYSALSNLSTGIANTAIGASALTNNNGVSNVAIGLSAGSGSTGSQNTAVGVRAGNSTTGNKSVFIGYEAGMDEVNGERLYIDNSSTSAPLLFGEFDKNRLTINDTLIAKRIKVDGGQLSFINSGNSVFVGHKAGAADDLTNNHNTFVGFSAGTLNTTGSDNSAFGSYALQGNVTGIENVAIGKNALGGGNNPLGNVAIGWFAFAANNNTNNVGIGYGAGFTSTGSGNVFIGSGSGQSNNGSNNVFIGTLAGAFVSGSDKLVIENSTSTTPLIYGDFASDKVAINAGSASSTFEVNGTMGATFRNGQVAGTNNPDGSGMIWRFTSGSGTITLPAAASCANRMYVIVNHTGAARNSSSYTNLSNAVVSTIANNASVTVVSDGSGWFQVK